MKVKIYLLACAILLCLPFQVSAVQYKIAMKECLYSFNDPDFGSWDAAAQKGIFFKINNSNLNSSLARPDLERVAQYTYTHDFQGVRRYWSTYNDTFSIDKSTLYTSVPMLQIIKGQDNFIYSKCTYNVGKNDDTFLKIPDPGQICSIGSGAKIYISYDFNLSDGPILGSEYDTYWGGIFYALKYNHQNVSLNWKESQTFPLEQIYYVDNKYSQSHDSSILYTPGLLPNTEPVIYSKMNITNAISGIFLGLSWHYENGGRPLIWEHANGADSSRYYLVFYINASSTREQLINTLLPVGIHTKFIFKNKRTGLSSDGYCSQHVVPNCTEFQNGDKIEATYVFNNPYNVDLKDIELTLGLGFDPSTTGIAADWIPDAFTPAVDVFRYWERNTTYFNISKKTEKNIYYNYTIQLVHICDILNNQTIDHPLSDNGRWYCRWNGTSWDNKPILAHGLGGQYTLENLHAPSKGYTMFWYGVGGHNESVPYFGRTSPTIILVNGKPAFNITLEIMVSTMTGFESKITPGEYNISRIIKVEGDPTLKKIDVPLDESAFLNMGLAPGENLSNNKSVEYSFIVDASDMAAIDKKIDISLFFVKTKPPYEGLKISRLNKPLSFKPAELQYASDKTFNLYNYQTSDTKKIEIFNPSMNLQKLKMSLSSPPSRDQERFTIQLVDDAKTVLANLYPQRNSYEVDMKRIEVKNFTLLVSRQGPWPASNTTATFKLNVSSDQMTSTEIEYNIITYEYEAQACKDVGKLVDAPARCIIANFANTEGKCSWNYTSEGGDTTSPDGDINSGSCMTCNKFPGENFYCGAYNNNLSCKKDHCDFKRDLFDECAWNYMSNKCESKKGECTYTSTTTCTIDQAYGKVIFDTTGATCADFSIDVPCAGYVQLPFFTPTQMITSVLLTSIIYLAILIRR